MDATAEITVRRAEMDDAEILTGICKRAFDSDSEVGSPGPGGPPGYDSVEWNRSIIGNPYLQYYKILRGGNIVGGFIAGDRGPGYQVCERIWVDPDHMKQGIGEKAFELIWQGYPSADLWALGTPEWNVRTNRSLLIGQSWTPECCPPRKRHWAQLGEASVRVGSTSELCSSAQYIDTCPTLPKIEAAAAYPRVNR